MSTAELSSVRNDAMCRLLVMYHQCIAETDPNDPWDHQVDVYGGVHAAICREMGLEMQAARNAVVKLLVEQSIAKLTTFLTEHPITNNDVIDARDLLRLVASIGGGA